MFQKKSISQPIELKSTEASESRRSTSSEKEASGVPVTSQIVETDVNGVTKEYTHSDVFVNVFEDSTHQFLVAPKSRSYFVLGSAILFTQCIAYGLTIVHASFELMDPSFTLKIGRTGCDLIDDRPQDLTLSDFPNVTCDLKHVWAGVPFILSAICGVLLMSDLAPDCVACISVMFPNKVKPRVMSSYRRSWRDRTFMASAVILIESVLACFAGGMFAVLAMNEGNSADAIMNCVAVLFLHDIDEKLLPLFKHLDADAIHARLLYCLFTTFFLVPAGLVGLLAAGGHFN